MIFEANWFIMLHTYLYICKIQYCCCIILCFFEILYDGHNHNTRKKLNNFKIKYSRTSQKASCFSVIGSKLWNNLHSDLQCSKSISRFKTH